MTSSQVTYIELDAPQLEALVMEAIRQRNPLNIGDSVSASRADGAGGFIFTAESTSGVFHETQVRIQIKHEESGGSTLIVTPGFSCSDYEANEVRKALEEKIDDLIRWHLRHG